MESDQSIETYTEEHLLDVEGTYTRVTRVIKVVANTAKLMAATFLGELLQFLEDGFFSDLAEKGEKADWTITER